MTSPTYTPPATRQTFAGSGRAPRLSFGGVLKSERIKLSSLRSIRITLLITLLASAGLSLLSAWAMKSSFSYEGVEVFALSGEALQSYLLTVSTFASPFLALIFGVLGVFVMSSEYSSGMILSSLAAVPKRSPMYFGKALVLAAIAAITALVLVVLGLAIGVLFLPDAASEMFSVPVLTGALGAIVYLVCVALLGFGFAAILRSTAGGISVVAGLIFVLPIGFQFLSMTGWEWVPTVSNYLPLALGSTLSMGDVAAGTDPGYWGAMLAIVLWAAVPAALGLAVLKSRDAK
ncbi:ABC-2 type transport system permease protein [Leucobacter komagatae]|uniref:ABC-2 type transport system permease protein n=1 Tax=Leucobacter komagatae TaxID=55969 RepID=A0A542Y432_9MICO|nr:ABC transporter permease subunit [Leucobacter komagatae]TQL42833.1 ABC-2 type transport system permease protein [Leucobacter komagatae]